jgi:hypothetical protein
VQATKRKFISGRDPRRFEVKEDYYEVVSGNQRYNRALYGALCEDGGYRFRALAGDIPDVLLYLPNDGGRVFFGVVSQGSAKWLSEFEYTSSQYDAGEMRYELKDEAIGAGVLSLSVIPLVDTPGIAVRIVAARVPDGTRFAFFYGCASGVQNGRAMDAGYCNADDRRTGIPFTAEGCRGNVFEIAGRSFSMRAAVTGSGAIWGQFSYDGTFRMVDATQVEKGILDLGREAHPDLNVICYLSDIGGQGFDGYAILRHTESVGPDLHFGQARKMHEGAKRHYHETLAGRAVAKTPEPKVNAGMRAACVASEGIWIPPVYVHGAWSWDIPIMGWRSMYGPIAFGWHDRVRTESRLFTGLQLNESLKPIDESVVSQLSASRFAADGSYFGRETKGADIVGRIPTGPEPDPDYDLARQSSKSIFVSEGMMPYMPMAWKKVMYNMQEVFFDELISEYYWTGDVEYARELFPSLKRHIEWEKRCFDADGDGLYENFANFWASDAIFASGAGCALASAYNYRANVAAGEMAQRLGEDPTPFYATAERIRRAMNEILWVEKDGHPAECRDGYGERLLHTSLSLPTIVHCAESGILDDFQIYQMMRYTMHSLERIPVEGCDGELIWNTNWVPYHWSVRDIDYADVFHASLAYYSIGRRADAYRLYSGALTDSTCNHVTPGAFMCVYEGKSVDFADTVSMFGRATVEGLFGIRPRMHERMVTISPGFPDDWREASIRTPDFSYEYRYCDGVESVRATSAQECEKELRLVARRNGVRCVRVDGNEAAYSIEPGIGHAYIVVRSNIGFTSEFEVEYSGAEPARFDLPEIVAERSTLTVSGRASGSAVRIVGVKDPQTVLSSFELSDDGGCRLVFGGDRGYHTLFLLVSDGMLRYWHPVDVEIRESLRAVDCALSSGDRRISLRLENNTARTTSIQARYENQVFSCEIAPYAKSDLLEFSLSATHDFLPGGNSVDVEVTGDVNRVIRVDVEDWQVLGSDEGLRVKLGQQAVLVPLERHFNDRVSDIFRHDYLSPRSPYCSLQVPVHLYPPNWCGTRMDRVKNMNDRYLRRSVTAEGVFYTSAGIPFAQVSEEEADNVVYVSKWDNFPDEVTVPVGVEGRRLYLLLTGYTNQMQCWVTNAVIEVIYSDACRQRLELVPPRNFRSMESGPGTEREEDRWCYGAKPLYRVQIGNLSERVGEAVPSSGKDDGIYAQVLDMNLRPKEIKSLKISAIANDIVVGLLGVTVL